jgi:hypothetical protein
VRDAVQGGCGGDAFSAKGADSALYAQENVAIFIINARSCAHWEAFAREAMGQKRHESL